MASNSMASNRLASNSVASPRPKIDIGDVLVALLLVSSCAITPRWAGAVSVADAALTAVIVAATLVALAGGWPTPYRAAVWRVLPPLWALVALELFATLLASSHSSALLSAVKDLWSLCYLLVPLILLGYRDASRLILTRWAAIGGTVVLSVWVFLEAGPRPAGPFPDPTYTGSWIAMAAILCGALRTRLVVLLPTIAIAVVGLIRVQSFAALASLAAGYAVLWVIRRRRVRMAVVAIAAIVGTTLPIFGFVLVQWLTLQIAPAVKGSALAHLQYTAGIRWDIWSQAWQLARHHPLGIGPGQFSQGDYYPTSAGVGYETHNTFLETAVELGWLGILAYLWLMLRLSHRGWAAAAAMVTAVICESTLHNAFNFRHVWIMVAVAFVASGGPANRPPADHPADSTIDADRLGKIVTGPASRSASGGGG